eukprot:m.363450 g.363450  ORF g.363450 m.363450 type:complete len:425 (+) comp20801_c0_seq4:300-1574(+)
MEFSFNFGTDTDEPANDGSLSCSSLSSRSTKRRRIEQIKDVSLALDVLGTFVPNASTKASTGAQSCTEIVHAEFNGGLVLKGVSARLVENEIAAMESIKEDYIPIALDSQQTAQDDISRETAKGKSMTSTEVPEDQNPVHPMPDKECENRSSDVMAASNLSSDVIPQVYEGGLKIWEGSGDLVNALVEHEITFTGLKVIELGCGAAFPGIYAMKNGARLVDFQDYNTEVLQHVTMPNVHLNRTEATSTSQTGVSDQQQRSAVSEGNNNADIDDKSNREDKTCGEGHRIDSRNSTDRCSIEMKGSKDRHREPGPTEEQHVVRYLAGDWACLQEYLAGATYDVVLTAETLYSPESIPVLYDAIKGCLQRPGGVAYVASKTYYFGVGGGTRQFRDIVTQDKVFDIDVILTVTGGVQREVLQLTFAKQ